MTNAPNLVTVHKRAQARWIVTDNTGSGYCSNCEHDIPIFMCDWKWTYTKTPYCPFCGARMKGVSIDD